MVLFVILPQILQSSQKYRDHTNYSVYSARSPWVLRSIFIPSFLHNVKRKIIDLTCGVLHSTREFLTHWKCKIMSVEKKNSKIHVSDLTLTLYVSFKHIRNVFQGRLYYTKLTSRRSVDKYTVKVQDSSSPQASIFISHASPREIGVLLGNWYLAISC